MDEILDFVRNLRFRLAHIAAILFVVVEYFRRHDMSAYVIGRQAAWRGKRWVNFIQRWLHRILFYDVPEWDIDNNLCAFLRFSSSLLSGCFRRALANVGAMSIVQGYYDN